MVRFGPDIARQGAAWLCGCVLAALVAISPAQTSAQYEASDLSLYGGVGAGVEGGDVLPWMGAIRIDLGAEYHLDQTFGVAFQAGVGVNDTLVTVDPTVLVAFHVAVQQQHDLMMAVGLAYRLLAFHAVGQLDHGVSAVVRLGYLYFLTPFLGLFARAEARPGLVPAAPAPFLFGLSVGFGVDFRL